MQTTIIHTKRPLTIIIASLFLALTVVFGVVSLFLNSQSFPNGRSQRWSTLQGSTTFQGGMMPQGGELPGGGTPPEGFNPPDGFVPPDGGNFPNSGTRPNTGLPNISRSSGQSGNSINMGWVALAIAGVGLLIGLIAALGLWTLKKWGIILAIISLVFCITSTVLGFLMPAARGLTWQSITGTGVERFFRQMTTIRIATPALYWQYILPVVAALVVIVLVLLPASRRAIAQKQEEDRSVVV